MSNYIKLLFFISMLIMGCASSDRDKKSGADCDTITAENSDVCLRLNQIQVLGTHNSYKKKPKEQLVKTLNKAEPGWAENIMYEHLPLHQQLDDLQARQFELDVYADPEGGRYAQPQGAVISNDKNFLDRQEMLEPGFKVLHVQDIDYRTTCLTLKSCLKEIRTWSQKNHHHIPIMVLLEAKDGKMDSREGFTFTAPIPIDSTNIFDLDEEILSVFSRNEIITPDDVRGEHETLEQAILEDGWPTLKRSRGKIMFALDNTGSEREAYLSRSETLKNRVLFVSSKPGHPSSAFIKMNDVIEHYQQIKDWVSKGYLIRTRSDLPLREAKEGNTKRRDRALSSGAQFISSDFLRPAPYPSNYQATFPNAAPDAPARCNPVSAPKSCRNGLFAKLEKVPNL